MVERLLREQEVACSNPVTPTKNPLFLRGFFLLPALLQACATDRSLDASPCNGQVPGHLIPTRPWSPASVTGLRNEVFIHAVKQ